MKWLYWECLLQKLCSRLEGGSLTSRGNPGIGKGMGTPIQRRIVEVRVDVNILQPVVLAEY